MSDLLKLTLRRSVRVNTGDYEGTEYEVVHEVPYDPVMDDLKEVHRGGVIELEEMLCASLQAGYLARGRRVGADAVAKRHGLGRLYAKLTEGKG